MSVFADAEVCLTCEKPLKSSDAFYCDAVCRAKDGASRSSTGQKNVHDSPSLLASLPALLASHAKISNHAGGVATQRERSSQGASASTSSHSESSSPLQSPSPLGHPTTMGIDASPKEDFFHLPPPAYPNAFAAGTPGLGFGSNPVKIPGSYTKSPNPLFNQHQHHAHGPNSQQNASLLSSYDQTAAATLIESTLQYGRRPGQTNSVTSPLAMLPVGSSHLRRDSQNKLAPNAMSSSLSRSHLANGGLNVAAPAARALSPTRNGGGLRAVSDSIKPRSRPDSKDPANRPFRYGMHSPLLMPTSSRPASTSAVDYATAAPTRPTTITAQSSPGPKPCVPETARAVAQPHPHPSPAAAPSGEEVYDRVNSLINRRRSFPVHLLFAERQRFNASSKDRRNPGSSSSRQVACADSAYDGDVDLASPLQDEVDDEPVRRGRSRERRAEDHNAVAAAEEDDLVHPPRGRDTALMGNRLEQRSTSRYAGHRGGESSSSREPRRHHHAHHRSSRSRSTSRSRERESRRSDTTGRGPRAARVASIRNDYNAAQDLETIMNSFQGSPLHLPAPLPDLNLSAASPNSQDATDRRRGSIAERRLKRMFEQGVAAS